MENSNLDRCGLIFSILVFLFFSFLSFNQIEEDTYIFMKTAANIADGYGYVFNRGEQPVETGSSALWQFFLVFLYVLPGYFIINIKLMGFWVGIMTLVVVYKMSKSLGPPGQYHFLVPLLLAVNTHFITHNQCGMDYGLAALVYCLFCWCLIDDKKRPYWPLLAILILLVRSEGFVMLVLWSPILIFMDQPAKKKVNGFLLVCATFVLIEFIRVFYFTDFFPSPFYKKISTSGLDGRIVKAFINSYYLQYLTPVLLLGLLSRKFWNKKYAIVLYFIFIVFVWGEISRETVLWGRRVLPAIALSCVLVVHLLNALCSRISQPGIRKTIQWTTFLCLVLGSAFYIKSNHFFNREYDNCNRQLISELFHWKGEYVEALIKKVRMPYQWTLLDEKISATRAIGTNYQALVGHFANKNYRKGSTIIYDQMGQTAYLAGLDKNIVDSFGLTDKYTAYCYYFKRIKKGSIHDYYGRALIWLLEVLDYEQEVPVDEKKAMRYLIGLNPDVIMINMSIPRWAGTLNLTSKIMKYAWDSPEYACENWINGQVLLCEKDSSRTSDGYDIPKDLTISKTSTEELDRLCKKIAVND